MPCFNPEDVIFLTNKWDSIIDACDESATQREIKKTWETLKRQIKNQWAAVQEENIFRLNLKDVNISIHIFLYMLSKQRTQMMYCLIFFLFTVTMW